MRGGIQTTATMKAIFTKDGETVAVYDKEELEETYQYNNIQQFSQSLDTPFKKGSLFADVGILAEGPGTEAILKGTYHPQEDLDANMCKFLKELQRPPQVQVEREIGLSLEDHIKVCQKARESTSCETSGLHCGHLKIGCLDPVIARFD